MGCDMFLYLCVKKKKISENFRANINYEYYKNGVPCMFKESLYLTFLA